MARSTPIPPWRSQKIWAAVIGLGLTIVLLVFGQTEAAIAAAALVSAFILGRGLERFGGALLLVLASLLGGCACFQAASALAHVDQSDSPEDVMAEVMPLILECSEQAAAVLGRCEAVVSSSLDISGLSQVVGPGVESHPDGPAVSP